MIVSHSRKMKLNWLQEDHGTPPPAEDMRQVGERNWLEMDNSFHLGRVHLMMNPLSMGQQRTDRLGVAAGDNHTSALEVADDMVCTDHPCISDRNTYLCNTDRGRIVDQEVVEDLCSTDLDNMRHDKDPQDDTEDVRNTDHDNKEGTEGDQEHRKFGQCEFPGLVVANLHGVIAVLELERHQFCCH